MSVFEVSRDDFISICNEHLYMSDMLMLTVEYSLL